MWFLAVLTIAAQTPASETVELAWRPAAGTVLERELEFEVSGGLGEEYADLLGAFGLRGLTAVSVTGRLRVRDEVQDVANGRPLVLVREYEHLATSWNGLARHDVCPDGLEQPLRFTWDASAGTYARNWVRPASRSEAPPALREDLDLRALLPDEPVRVGDVWRVPVSSVAGLLAPAGGLHVDAALSEAWGFDELGHAFELERVRRVRDGDVQCLLERIVRVEGRRMAVIEVGWTWWGTIDPFLTPRAGTWIARVAPGSVSLDVAGRAWGRLLWDLEGGHAREFELQAELEGSLGGPRGRPLRARGSWFTTITPR